MFGNFWTNVVILVNFWSFNPLHVQVAQALMRQKFILLVRFAQKFIKGCQLSSKNVTTRLRYDDILHVQIARIFIARQFRELANSDSSPIQKTLLQ